MLKGINIKRALMLVACLTVVFALSGCGKNGVNVVINDRQIVTELFVKDNATVKDAIEAAEITLNEKDEVSPALSEVVSEGTSITIKRHTTVTVVKDGEEKEVELTGASVLDAIEAAELTYTEYDYINHDLMAYLSQGMVIDIITRYPIIINADGENFTILTSAKTVEEALLEQGIVLDKKDKVSPALDSALAADTKIVVNRVATKTLVVKEAIPFENETEYSSSMYKDESTVTVEGVDGVKEVEYLITYVDGKEQSRKVISEKVITEPVNGVVTVGTRSRDGIVSKVAVYDCDGSGHGYYIITYEDGHVEYVDF